MLGNLDYGFGLGIERKNIKFTISVRAEINRVAYP